MSFSSPKTGTHSLRHRVPSPPEAHQRAAAQRDRLHPPRLERASGLGAQQRPLFGEALPHPRRGVAVDLPPPYQSAARSAPVTELAAALQVEATSRALHLPTVRQQASALAEAALRDRLTHLAYLAEVLSVELAHRD